MLACIEFEPYSSFSIAAIERRAAASMLRCGRRLLSTAAEGSQAAVYRSHGEPSAVLRVEAAAGQGGRIDRRRGVAEGGGLELECLNARAVQVRLIVF